MTIGIEGRVSASHASFSHEEHEWLLTSPGPSFWQMTLDYNFHNMSNMPFVGASGVHEEKSALPRMASTRDVAGWMHR
jgi:hypothetical protein